MKVGLCVGGSDGSSGMVNELFNTEGQWTTLPVSSPYGNIDYPYPCSVPLCSTHIFFSGGYGNGNRIVNTWICYLEKLGWTPSTHMLTTRGDHGRDSQRTEKCS